MSCQKMHIVRRTNRKETRLILMSALWDMRSAMGTAFIMQKIDGGEESEG